MLLEVRASKLVGRVPREWKQRVKALERPAGWDGEDAPAVTHQLSAAVVDFLAEAVDRYPSLPEPAAISPTVTGAMMLQWERNGWTIAVSIPGNAPSLEYQMIDAAGVFSGGIRARETVLAALANVAR